MSTISSFRSIENKHDACRGKDCIKQFREYLSEHAIKITLLTKERLESYEYYIRKEKLENKYLKNKQYGKVRGYCYYIVKYRGAMYSICNLKYSVPKKILIVSQLWLSFYHQN